MAVLNTLNSTKYSEYDTRLSSKRRRLAELSENDLVRINLQLSQWIIGVISGNSAISSDALTELESLYDEDITPPTSVISSPGATIPIVRKNSPVYQPSVFTGRTYTASADTLAPIDPRIDLLPSGVYTITNTITGHSNPIIFTFLEFNDGSDEAPGSDSYVNVYSGTGTGKTLLWKFDGGEDGGTYPTGNYTINATSATFEYHNGYDGMRNEWMKISYW